MCDKTALRGDKTWKTCRTEYAVCPVEAARFDILVSDDAWFCLRERCERGSCEKYGSG